MTFLGWKFSSRLHWNLVNPKLNVLDLNRPIGWAGKQRLSCLSVVFCPKQSKIDAPLAKVKKYNTFIFAWTKETVLYFLYKFVKWRQVCYQLIKGSFQRNNVEALKSCNKDNIIR